MATYKEYCERAVALGATIELGINWTWANGFPTQEAAQAFIDSFPEMETRGIYEVRNSDKPEYDVRFR